MKGVLIGKNEQKTKQESSLDKTDKAMLKKTMTRTWQNMDRSLAAN